jgi:protocatechuate 3,4-dioxygenase beta subunit
MITRRSLLGSLLALPVVARAEDCPEATLDSVLGPFAPESFHPTLGGRKNPGVRRPVVEDDLDLATIRDLPKAPAGQVVRIRGRVDAGCRPVGGARVLLWQADHAGAYNHRNERDGTLLDAAFAYWGEGTTDAEGRFEVRTIVPGAYPASSDWWRPPHLHWTLRKDGFREVTTQTFFDGDVLDGIAKIRELNEADDILNLRGGFEGALRGRALDLGRKRVRDEQVVRFAAGDAEPVGDLVFRLSAT